MDEAAGKERVAAYLRDQADMHLSNAKLYGEGLDREQLLAKFVETGDRGALECYRMLYTAETLKVYADAIEDGRHLWMTLPEPQQQ